MAEHLDYRRDSKVGQNSFHVANLLQETNSTLHALIEQSVEDQVNTINILKANQMLQQQLLEANQKIAELAQKLQEITI